MKKFIAAVILLSLGSMAYAQSDANYWKYSTTSRELTPDVKQYWANNVELQEKELKKCWNSPKKQFFRVPAGSKQWNICAEIYAVNEGINTIQEANEKLIRLKNYYRKGITPQE